MCSKHNNKTPQQVMRFFVLFLYRIFPSFSSFFVQKSSPLMASSHQQRPNGASVVPLSKYKLVFLGVRSCYHRPLLSFAFCFLFSGALSLSFFFFFFFTLFVFQKSPFPAILFSLLLNLLPRAIKELLPKKKKKKKKEKPRKSVPCNRFGFVVVLLKNNALLTFPLYLFNRTNRLGKRPSSLASCTTNSTRRTKRRSASIFYRKRYTWRILEAFDYNCGIQLARSDFDR